jgi:uncharacterized protein (DUF1800 family)
MIDASPFVAAIRFGLGPRLEEPLPRDPQAWLVAQIDRAVPPPEGPSVADALRARHQDILDRDANQGVPPGRTRALDLIRADQLAWAERRLTTAQPYRERLVDFWMNHFTVSGRDGGTRFMIGAFEREAIRPHVAGRFADMLVAVTLHPAMLNYLNNTSSVGPNSAFGARAGRGLNENLAREVLELHTLSPAGGYTQGDVTEFAKVLTGWSVAQRAEPFGTVFRPQAHEPGPKYVMGRTWQEGRDEAEAVLRFLAAQPATHRHLAVKLVRHFVADDPPPAAVRRIEAVLRDTDGDLGAVSRALPKLEEAWARPLGKLRAPQDWVVAACRGLGLPGDQGAAVIGGMATLAQPLWSPQQPNGWPDIATAWATPEGLMRRVDWAHTISARGQRLEVRMVADAVLGPLLRAETVTAVTRAGSVREALTMIFTAPEFMRR